MRVLGASWVLWGMLLLSGNNFLRCQYAEVEQKSRRAIKRLILAPESEVKPEFLRTLALGRVILPDIEQEFVNADWRGRIRLLEVLEKLADREALPFVSHVARYEKDPKVKEKAHLVAKSLSLSP